MEAFVDLKAAGGDLLEGSGVLVPVYLQMHISL